MMWRMIERDIAKQRLVRQGLVKPTLETATKVVAMLGAVQAQDYAGSKWGLAQRTRGLTDAQIEKEIDDGTIVRTHILRPTWHFVAVADVGWMLALSAPRVQAANAHWYRWLEVDDVVARRGRIVLTKALRGGKQLTRTELGHALGKAKIQVANPQRLAAIMMRAELDGIICSGARRGKRFTYALFEERVVGRPLWSVTPHCSSSRGGTSRPADLRRSTISPGGQDSPKRMQRGVSTPLRRNSSTRRSMVDRTGLRPGTGPGAPLQSWRTCCRTTTSTSSA